MIVAASPFVFFHFSAIFWTIILQSRLDDVNVRYPNDAVLSHPGLLAVANLARKCRGGSCPLISSSSPLPFHCFIPKIKEGLKVVSMGIREVGGA